MQETPILLLRLENLALCSCEKNIEFENTVFISVPSMQMQLLQMDEQGGRREGVIKIPCSFFSRQIAWEGKRIEVSYFQHGTRSLLNKQRGIISTILYNNNEVTLRFKNLFSILENKVGVYFSEKCRANFCDDKCGLERENFTISGKIDTISSGGYLYDKNLIISDFNTFYEGKVIFEKSGEEIGVVEAKDGYIFLLSLPLFWEQGENYKLVQGCDKTLSMCSQTYKNAINFRGEPFIFDNFPSSSLF